MELGNSQEKKGRVSSPVVEMMHPARSVPPLNAAGVGHGRRSSATAWTGEKRRKTVGAPSPSLGLGSDDADATEAMLMDAQVQEEELVFSAESVLDFAELALCYEVLKSRENHIYPSFTARLDQDGKQKVVERYYRYRYIEFKLKEGTASLNLDDTTDTVPMSEYPDEVLEFESPNKPGRGMFGWTFDLKTFDYANLDDYQRMVPKRASLEEYSQWDKYRLAFSNYETDEEYVKYWGELFKKIKWIEEYIHLDYYEFARYKTRGASHAMKIAQRFCHLPASLATLGYNEYLNALDDSFDLQEDNGRVYLELWKRMTKQGMSFQDALQDILASDNKLPTPCLHRIKSTIMGYEYDILSHFRTCEKHIGKHIVDDDDDDTVLKLITDVLNTKIKRRKWYVDYAKTKLDVARRIRMLPGMARAGEGLRTAHPKL